ncbi:general transcription factor II-I repeat domain-containing protein 2 [Trichonephila inaurata madagascariensis]|uniref:General transcription factor II-I repeat domain-containing protein 2 n=1 Tax=Trichonephila inaurata madagascariensis TaxID=2747483 RepID=A0A8X7CDJ9_9ARAC|nr:general transcription factor II-I repeat domain-containing protein 2 [Trichonephila inaurata madagascariensis]
MKADNIDCALVQEPHSYRSSLPSYPSTYRLFYDPNSDIIKAAIIVRSRHLSTFIDYKNTDYSMVTLEVITGSTAFTLFSYYFEPSKNIDSDLHKISQVFSSKNLNRLVWSMDSNSKSELWFSLYSDARGDKLSEFISANNLFIINEECGPTFRATQGTSHIDITVVGSDLLEDNLNRRQEEEPMDWEDAPFLPEVSAPFVPSRPPRKMRSIISVQVSETPSLSANRFPNMRALVPKVNLFKSVSLSANTVARRVQDIAENISSQLCDKNGHHEWFSLALDESTDVSDTAQVLIFIRGVDKSYEVYEELLDIDSIHGTATGADIFKGVENAINKKNLRWRNLKSITTDGGKNMCGKNKGVVALVSKAVENDGGSKPLVLHCIIHQQSLCGKCLDMSEVLKPVISVFNFIRSTGLNHRQFREFIEEIGENVCDLPYHTVVRWLSCGKVLERFFELRAEIEIFLNVKQRPFADLENSEWMWKLAFYVDLTNHTNELNLRLQGENQLLPDLYTNISNPSGRK